MHREFEAYARGFTVPEEHCLAIATYLQSSPLEKAINYERLDNTTSPHFLLAEQLQSDAELLLDQLLTLGLRFGFRSTNRIFHPWLITPPGILDCSRPPNWSLDRR